MSYEERNTWAFIVIAPVGYALYLVLSFMTGGGPLDAETYVWPMAWAITGGIVAGILTGIVIGMAGSRRVDQRDKEIGWFGSRIGNMMIVLGGVGALILCFMDASQVYVANVLYLGFVLAAILQSAAKLVAYRRGF